MSDMAVLANRAKGNHIITSKTEHPAVLQSCKYLSTIGFDVDYVNTSPDGELDLIQFQKNIKKNTILVSIMTANNETGCLNPIYSIAELLNETDIFFHTDAIQSFGKMDFLVNTIPVDLMSVSSHKIYGPKGIGFLYKRRGIQIKNILHGGAQEKNLRPGTENVVAIAGFAEAVKQLYKKKDERKRIENLRNMFEQELQKAIPGIIINGGKSNRLFCHSNIYFPFYSGDTLLMNLDLQNVSVSSGSACSSGSNAPSHVLEAMQLPQEQINSSLRFSFGRYTNKRDVQNVVNILKQLYQKSKTGLNSSV